MFCLGGVNAVDSLELARKKFHSISYSDLEKSDFMKSKDDSGKANRLFEKTKPQKLGCCDAFIRSCFYFFSRLKTSAHRKSGCNHLGRLLGQEYSLRAVSGAGFGVAPLPLHGVAAPRPDSRSFETREDDGWR